MGKFICVFSEWAKRALEEQGYELLREITTSSNGKPEKRYIFVNKDCGNFASLSEFVLTDTLTF